MSTLNQSPINHEEFISLAERVTSKLQSLEDSPNPTSSEAKVKQVTQNTIKLCHELLVQADDVLKLQLGSLNGVPEQINVTSQESIGPLSIDSGLEEIPSFSSRPIQPTQRHIKPPLHLDSRTISAIKEEVQTLLPTTIVNVCSAIIQSEKVLTAFANKDDVPILPLGIPTVDRRFYRRNEFRFACVALASRDATVELTSWEKVEEKLSEVFLFLRTIRPLPMNNRQARPLRQRGSMTNTCLSISAYKQRMKVKMGASKFERIFNHSAAIKSYDELAKDINDQIGS